MTGSQEDLQKAGAEARAHGLSALDNPFYRTPAMPAATGESFEDWDAKGRAWNLGWQMEDTIRS